MANDLNRVSLIGRLTREPELRSTDTGAYLCRFTLANNQIQYVKDGDNKEHVGFYDCVAWGKLAEIISKYAQKGKQIAVDGKLSFSSWENSEGKKQSKVEIRVENMQLLGGKSEGSSEQQPEPQAGTSEPFSDDIPF